MDITTNLLVRAIEPARLDTVRATGTDGHGNNLSPFAAAGQGEPLRCDGYSQAGGLPARLATGPRVLRTYRADDTMNYDHNTVVTDESELEPIIERLLTEPDVATVHVRTLAPQCFLYAVTAANQATVFPR